MVAPLAIAAGLAGRYGAKKVIKGLATKAQKKMAKDQVKDSRAIAKDKGPSKASTDKFNSKMNEAVEGLKKKDQAKTASRIKKAPNQRIKKKAQTQGYKKGGSIDGCAIKGHTKAKR